MAAAVQRSKLAEASDNTSQEATPEVGQEASVSFAQAATRVPHRMQQVLLNWIFIVASVALILDLAALQDMVRNLESARPLNMFDELCNWFGVLSCLCWLLGFILLAHWLHSVGATRCGLAGCYMKLVASVFFNLQPMTGTMNDALLGGPAGLWWSNLTGILFFHGGNIVSCVDFCLHTPPGASKDKGWLYHGNLPITGMWIFQAATWFLVASNLMACSFDGASWAPLAPTSSAPVFVCQFAGSGLLLVGSVVYTIWCDGFRNLWHP